MLRNIKNPISLQINNAYRKAKADFKGFKAEVDEHREHCSSILREFGMKSEEYTQAIKKQASMEQDLRTLKIKLKEFEQTFQLR
jgi:hypothetical protein